MSNAALRAFLIAKGKLGRFDRRMLAYYDVPNVDNGFVRRFIARGYGAGLVPTATTNGVHSAHSLHYLKRAADLGLRRDEIGTTKGLRRMRRFQRREFRRARRGRHYVELIGPVNDRIVLRGHSTSLPEGSSLEEQHDNHVHGGF